MRDKTLVVLASCCSDYPGDVPFDPPQRFPELSFAKLGNNILYSGVREALFMLGLDRKRFNTQEWNPLGELVSQGQTVLIKPNFVKHFHPLGDDAVLSSITHGSVLRPLIDYAYKAVGPTGRIIIADTPLEKTDFAEVLRLTGVGEMVTVLNERDTPTPVQVLDLRQQRLSINEYLEPVVTKLAGDPKGYVSIDLGNDSEFHELDTEEQNYHTLGDHSVNYYDPFTVEKGQPNKYHYPGVHRHVVSRTILEADLVISIPKLKTHKKAGVTISLKNMIGMVPSKESMPHHRPGMPPYGDSFPVPPHPGFVRKRNFAHVIFRNRALHRIVRGWIWPRVPRSIQEALLREENPPIEWGDWYGNDTIWRTIVDLNKILFYADKDGNMHKNRQRNYLAVVDGIIGQEGEGPMEGRPRPTGLLIAGLDPVAVDAVAADMTGLDFEKIKTIAGAAASKVYPLGCASRDEIIVRTVTGSGLSNLRFCPPRGWVGHIEKSSEEFSFCVEYVDQKWEPEHVRASTAVSIEND